MSASDWPKVKLSKIGTGITDYKVEINGHEVCCVLDVSWRAGVNSIPICSITFECELDVDASE